MNSGGELYLTEISNGAVISETEITKVVTDEAGTFTFGGDSQKVTVKGDDTVEFTVDATKSTVSAVSSITGTTLSASSDTTKLQINNDEVEFNATSKAPTFVIDNSGKITQVSNSSVVSGLTGDVNVIETSSASVQGVNVGVANDTSYSVTVVGGQVGEVSSLSGDAVVNMANATLNTDENGTFTFVDTTYLVDDTDKSIQFITDENGNVTAIDGLVGSVKTTYNEITINGTPVKISTDEKTTITYIVDENGAVRVEGLPNNSTIEGGETDGITISGGGNVITGLDSDAYLQIDTADWYFVNGDLFKYEVYDTIHGTAEGTAETYSEGNIIDVDDTAASDVDSLTSWLVDTENYATLNSGAQETVLAAVTSTSTDKSAADGDMRLSYGNSSNAEQVTDFSRNTGKKDVTLKKGNQTVKFNDEGSNIAEIGADATGNKNIELGKGGDLVIVAKGTKASINVTAGKGADMIVSGSNANIDVGNGGATKVYAIGNSVLTMNNYDATSKAGVQTASSHISAAIYAGNIKLNDGEVTTFGFTHSEGGTVDLSGQKAGVIVQGNSSGAKSSESTLLSGSGDDVIFAGSGDIIDAGAGKNAIFLNNTLN